PEPAAIDPTIPSGFSQFVTRLLHVDPALRFADARSAASALVNGVSLDMDVQPELLAAERLLLGGALSHRPRIVKRAKKIARALGEGQRVQSMFIEAPVGLGKTPLLRELGIELNLQGLRV